MSPKVIAGCDRLLVLPFGILVPRNVHQAFELDEGNGNTLLQETMT
jgi:hypothetical protein